MHEIVTKRVIWVAECDCNPEEKFRKMWIQNPPRECQCPLCGKWIVPKEDIYIGKDRFND